MELQNILDELVTAVHNNEVTGKSIDFTLRDIVTARQKIKALAFSELLNASTNTKDWSELVDNLQNKINKW